jgi:hypothetical protein
VVQHVCRVLAEARAASIPIFFTTFAYDPAEPPSPHDNCEPTAHRFVWKVFPPPPHHPLECRREPTAAAWLGVG